MLYLKAAAPANSVGLYSLVSVPAKFLMFSAISEYCCTEKSCSTFKSLTILSIFTVNKFKLS